MTCLELRTSNDGASDARCDDAFVAEGFEAHKIPAAAAVGEEGARAQAVCTYDLHPARSR
jgi:hypothetical protein